VQLRIALPVSKGDYPIALAKRNQIADSNQFETRAKNMRDLVSSPLKADRDGRRRNNRRHPTVSVISANCCFHARHVDLRAIMSANRSAPQRSFTITISKPENAPSPSGSLKTRRGSVGFQRRGGAPPSWRSQVIRGALRARTKKGLTAKAQAGGGVRCLINEAPALCPALFRR